nr:hypothetical protein [Tanacetum cinerariifolium]
MGYSAIASPLTDLLKKNQPWIWDKECQAAFESLKKKVMEEPMLRLPYVTMPLELHTNASDFAIRGVLMLDGHLIAFESQKLNETKRKYTYKMKKANVVADALSCKAEFVAITQAQFFLQVRIKEGLKHDPLAKKIIALAKDRKTWRFWLKGDMLFTKGDRWAGHNSKWAGHPRIKRTLILVEGTYYWPRMEDDVETFVRTCLVFQKDKIKQKKSRGLLEPLLRPKRP